MQHKLLKTISISSVIIGVLFISYSLNLFKVNASNHTFGPGNTQGTFGTGNTQGTFGSGNTQGTFGPGNPSNSNGLIIRSRICNDVTSLRGIRAILLYPACIINRLLVPLAIALEILFFVFGVIKYLSHADNEEERRKGNKFMVWGIIAIFITVSVWGILRILVTTIQLGK